MADAQPFAKQGLADLLLVLDAKAPGACAQSDVMLARLAPSGILELVNWGTWARALGYRPSELGGKSLCELLAHEGLAPREIVAALLDPGACEPLDVTLRGKDERRVRLRLHRRFDAYAPAVFLVAEVLGAAGG